MTLFLAGRRAPRRRWLALASTVVGLTALTAVVALAAVLPAVPLTGVLPGSTFEGADGNFGVDQVASGGTDWSSGSIRANAKVLVDITSGSGDNGFGSGTKEDVSGVTVVNGSIPPNKNDLTRAYVASEGVNGNAFVYLGWERVNNTGSANLDFELNQAPTPGFTGTKTGAVTLVRTPGDLLVTYDFSGSGAPVLGVLRWLTAATGGTCFSSASYPCWGNRVQLDPTTGIGAVNTIAVTDAFTGKSLGIGLFGEAAINLSAFFPGNGCETLGNVTVKSRSSSSFNAEVKDFIAPTAVNISNCGTLVVQKVTSPAGLTGPFDFTSSSPAIGSFTLTGDGSTDTTVNLPASTPYTVTEGTASGWTLTGISCSDGTNPPVVPPDLSSRSVTVTIQPNQVITCTFTNTQNTGTLIVSKVTSPAGLTGPFDFTSATAALGSFRLTGDGSTATFANLVAQSPSTGTYTIRETAQAHWRVTGISCAVTAGTGTALYSQSTGDRSLTVTIQPDQTLSCTFTNTQNTGTLIVQKATSPAGLSGPFDFTSATGALSSFRLTSDGSSATFANLVAQSPSSGTYTIRENALAGWQVQSIGCTVTAGGGSAVYSQSTGDRRLTVTIQPDQTLTCTYTNYKLMASPSGTGTQWYYPQARVSISGRDYSTGGTGGTWTLTLYGPFASGPVCTGTAVYTATLNVDPATASSTNVTNNTTYKIDTLSGGGGAGIYVWKAVYSGDSRNNGFTLSCGFEQFKVGP